MLYNVRFFLLAIIILVVGLFVFFNRLQEVTSINPQIIPVPTSVAKAANVVPIVEVKNEIAAKPQVALIKREPKPDTTTLEPCFSYWLQKHKVKYFDRLHFSKYSIVQKNTSGVSFKYSDEISLENQPVGSLSRIICNLKVRNEFYSVMLTTQGQTEKLIEITEGWLKPSGEALEVYRPDGSAFKQNQVLGFWGALELDGLTTSVIIRNCGAELGWGLQCPQPR